MIMKDKIQFDTEYVTIEPDDWDCHNYLSDIAERIVADWKFKDRCKKINDNK